jgi:hypothetical protein
MGDLHWVVSKNTQTPKFQIFPGRLGSSKRKNLGVGPKNRKGGGGPPFLFFFGKPIQKPI